MARIHELLRQLRLTNAALADDIEREVDVLGARRAFGLNFERHTPEAVELPGRPVRTGDKVHILPPRGETPKAENDKLWRVVSISGKDDRRVAELESHPRVEPVVSATVPTADLVVVAEFRDPIYPGLVSTGKVERGGDKPFHTVISAENYHALQALLFTHRGKVDAIYIDPPYNTGARDWKYNNDYVESDDLYRHSKWLAFMERRLVIAKELLNPQHSVLILAIDENEVNTVGLLLRQVFTESKVQMVTVLTNPAGASIIDQFSRVEEYLFFVNIGAARPQRTVVDTTPGYSTFVDASGNARAFSWEPFQRSGGNSRRQDTKAKFFPVYFDSKTGRVVGCGDQLPLDVPIEMAPPPPSGCVEQWPIKQDGSEACWQLSAPTFREYLAQGRIKATPRKKSTGRFGLSFLTSGHMSAIENGELEVHGRDENGSLIVKNAEGRVRSQIGKTLWTNGAYSATEHGSSLLNKIIPGRKFPFPKSLYAVEDALRHYLSGVKDAVVLDFFAGSGTTAHAVMRLNRQDNGSRSCILVTNNEVAASEQLDLRKRGLRPGDADWESQGIYELVTKARVTAAVTGKTPSGDPLVGEYRFVDEFPFAEGFEENVAFLRLSYESPLRIRADRDFGQIAKLLWLRSGGRGRVIDALPHGWAVSDTYGVLRDLDKTDAFIRAVNARRDVSSAFLMTDDDGVFEAIVAGLPEGVEPVRLHDAYFRNFEIDAMRGVR